MPRRTQLFLLSQTNPSIRRLALHDVASRVQCRCRARAVAGARSDHPVAERTVPLRRLGTDRNDLPVGVDHPLRVALDGRARRTASAVLVARSRCRSPGELDAPFDARGFVCSSRVAGVGSQAAAGLERRRGSFRWSGPLTIRRRRHEPPPAKPKTLYREARPPERSLHELCLRA